MTRTIRNGMVKAKRRAPGLIGNAEWEAMKARGRNLRPDQAVRECADLSAEYRRRWSMPEISLDKIITALQAKKVPFVLTGAHGIATWTGRPRSTHDVDILVKSARNHARAVKAIQALYRDLEMRNFTGGVAFFVPGERLSVIDVMSPFRLDLRETISTAINVLDQGMRYTIPTLETAMANKYGASRTQQRDVVERAMDTVDFGWMWKHSLDEGREPIDMERLMELGELVWPGGGGEEITHMVEEAKAGRVPNPMGSR